MNSFLLQSHKHHSVDHFLLKTRVLAFPFSGFKDRMRCTASESVIVCLKPKQARAVAGETNLACDTGKKGLQKARPLA